MFILGGGEHFPVTRLVKNSSTWRKSVSLGLMDLGPLSRALGVARLD